MTIITRDGKNFLLKENEHKKNKRKVNRPPKNQKKKRDFSIFTSEKP